VYKGKIIFSLVILVFVLTLSAPATAGWRFDDNSVKGSGDMVTEERQLDSFSAVELQGSPDVYITVGGEQKVEITADDNLIDLILTRVKRDELVIYNKTSYSTRKGIKVKITVPKLEQVNIEGSGDMYITGVDGTEFSINIDGSGDIEVAGKVEDVEIEINGSGDVDASELIAQFADVEINGSGDVTVYADEDIRTSINGSGDVDVLGKARDQYRKARRHYRKTERGDRDWHDYAIAPSGESDVTYYRSDDDDDSYIAITDDGRRIINFGNFEKFEHLQDLAGLEVLEALEDLEDLDDLDEIFDPDDFADIARIHTLRGGDRHFYIPSAPPVPPVPPVPAVPAVPALSNLRFLDSGGNYYIFNDGDTMEKDGNRSDVQ